MELVKENTSISTVENGKGMSLKKETVQSIPEEKKMTPIKKPKYKSTDFVSLFLKGAVWFSASLTAFILIFIIGYILAKGIPNITPQLFEWEYNTDNVSFLPAIINTVIMVIFTLVIAAPIGIFSAVYLTEYAKRGNKLVKLVRVTTETLSGIPSIVFGLFGALFFVKFLHWELSLISGAFTLAIMVLPLIMRTTEEALKSVDDSYREGSFGLGAGKLRTVFLIILPAAAPGILSGIILSVGRIVGETAALMYTAGTIAKIPSSAFSSARTLAVHMYALYSEGLYTNQAYATAVILLITVIIINFISTATVRKFTKGK